jgi:Glycosyl hydrolases family 2/Glycosyl hydrolases family 2, sugar binding domain/Glycosyl hydrolases family 2, TIM barrel domain
MNRWFGRLVSFGTLWGILHAVVGLAETARAWQPAKASLMTRWATDVSATNSHPEYPRPQLTRPDWQNLNGLWEYSVRPMESGPPEKYDGEILVPFPLESALSGVMKPLGAKDALWYRRTARIPAKWKGRRIRLQFGAVDWQCKVLINGREVGQHRGGYDRFAFDITDCLHWDQPEEIIVIDTDPTEGDQPRGKQSLHPQGIFYSSNSGIWQTVWLEPVPEMCIDGLWMTPDLDAKGLRLRVAVNSLADDLEVEAVASANGAEAGRVSGHPGAEMLLPLTNPNLWSPDSPFLYDLEVTLKKGGEEVDRVSSYFGMRQIALLKDAEGIARILLNGRSLFQVGTLDQGFWPDGIYTAPTDDALRSDIAFLKAAGFNLTRKHVKIEPDRWYYWCDKLGLLVWQDMPSANNATPEGQREFEAELLHMVKDLYNHPSIILWVLFNEGWGQYDTQRLSQCLKALDPSRLVDDASGWADTHAGDIVDGHSYPGPATLEPERRRATAVGEFGGLGMIPVGHTWSSNSNLNWAYRMEPDAEALKEDYLVLLRQVWSLHHLHGLSAAVYTQTTDVETECNGLLSYDRAVSKLPPEVLAQANAVGRDQTAGRVIVPDAISANVSWSYTFQPPGQEWFKPDFNAAGWKEGVAGFGSPGTPGALVHTVWNTSDIWLRRQFSIGTEDLRGLKLEAHHDEDLQVYLNGVLAAQLPGFIEQYEQFDLRPEAVAALKPGTNTLAVHCHQTVGGQYVDVGLIVPDAPVAPAK